MESVSHSERTESLSEAGRRRLGKVARLFRVWRVKHCAVFGYHSVEEVNTWQDAQQVVQFPPRQENQVAATCAKSLQCGNCRSADNTVIRDGAVIIGCKDCVVHLRLQFRPERRGKLPSFREG